eukprot:3423846-Amphidinium_carterae.2
MHRPRISSSWFIQDKLEAARFTMPQSMVDAGWPFTELALLTSGSVGIGLERLEEVALSTCELLGGLTLGLVKDSAHRNSMRSFGTHQHPLAQHNS